MIMKRMALMLMVLCWPGSLWAATLIANNVPYVCQGGATPQMCSSSITATSAGSIGIGTSAPQFALDVPSSAHFLSLNLNATSTGGASGSDFWIGQGGANGGKDLAINGGTGTTTGGIEFDINNAATLFLSPNGDIYSPPSGNWSDYSASSTIVGWSSISSSVILTKKIGKIVFVYFNISGTSNTTTVTFTLPYSCNSNSLYWPNGILATTVDRSTNLSVPGKCYMGPGSNTVVCVSSPIGGAWTASGTKIVQGQFWYQSS
ncbi:MAG: hypothetical protein HQL13_00740 [Candidatus Omnitrophica bacterium]|nr:hypothetical protein [Candidatus Omnitrophota bacterium]